MIILVNIATFLVNYPIILLTEIFSLVSISEIGLKSFGCASSTRGDIIMMSLVARRFSVVLFVIFLFAAALSTTAAYAQTDYNWNLPSGGTGTWDTSSINWNDPASGTANNYQWLNTGSERANFANTAGTVTLGAPITAYGINLSVANYSIQGSVSPNPPNLLTLSGAGGVISVSTGTDTIAAPIGGLVGLTKTGNGTLQLSGANIYSGGTTVSAGTLTGIPQLSGSPFSSGPITLIGAALNLKALTTNTTTTTVGDLTVSGTTTSASGASNLIIDNTNAGVNTTTLAAGNLVRGGAGGALVITPQAGLLGTKEIVTFTNGNSLVTNGILPPWVVATPTIGSTAADFVTYGSGALAADYNHNGVVDAGDYVLWRKDPANNGGAGGYDAWRQSFGNTGGGGTGVSVANYTSTDLTTSTSSSVVNQSTVPTIAGNVAAYALKTNQTIDLGGNSLTLGNGSGQSGLILNGGSITGGNISFGPTEGVVYSQGAATTLGSTGTTISSNGLTITGVGATSMTINGNIVDGTQPAKLIFTGAASATGLALNGTNLYSGGTILGVNNSAGPATISVGNDSAFGLGKVTNILLPGTSSPLMQATGADHTLANAFDLNGGLTFNGSQSITFTGPFNVINSATGGTRTLSNTIATSGKSITYGSAGSPSTITLGNPVSNGGDGVGKQLAFSASASSTTVINDVLQDPAAGGGTASGSVVYNGSGSPAGVIQLNSLNTYTGQTLLNGVSTIQFNHDYNAGDPSGPFGLGTIVANNGSNNNLQPIGADRVIANPISMVTGFTANNSTASGETARSLTLSGPIKMNQTQTRTARSNMTGGTLILGLASNPSTITLNDSAFQSNGTTPIYLDFATNGTPPIIVNDVVQDGAAPGALQISNTGTITFTAQNTYSGGIHFIAAGTIVPVVISSIQDPNNPNTPGALKSGPFGIGTIEVNNGTNQKFRPIGANRTIGNAITMTTGFAMDNATYTSGQNDFGLNLTFSGPISMTAVGKTISSGQTAHTNGGSMILGDAAQPSTITLATASGQTLDLNALAGPIVVNDVIQNANGPVVGNVRFNTSANDNNPVTLNAQNTFTGTATIGTSGFGNVQLGVSSVGDFGSITSGPFGKGTLISSNTAATTPAIVPFGADRTVSNGVTLNGNLAAANAGAETFNLNLTGPIALGGTGRTINNKMAGALTLGQSTVGASANAITLSTTAGSGGALTFTGGGTSTTVVNDVIQNFAITNPGNVVITGGVVQFNNANTYGLANPQPGDLPNTTVSGGKLLVNNTSGSATGTGKVSVTGGVLGGTGTISSSLSVTGGAVAPGSTGAGTLNVGSDVTFAGTSGFNVELGGTNAGTDYDQLLVGGKTDLTAAFGTVTVSLINGFNPLVDTDFTVLTAASGITLSGGTVGFNNFVYPDLTHWSKFYTANSLVVHYSAAGGAGAGDGLSRGGAVPEPGTLVLLICAIGSILFTSPRTSRR
jgi:autotransporter-associated beta strand protein